MTVLHCHHEWQRIDLLQRALVEQRVDLEPVLLLRVHVVVLGGSHDGVALNTLNIANGHLPCEDRILPQSLKQATKDGDASDVESWAEQDVVPCCPGFCADHVAVTLGGGKIPCGS